MQNHTFTSIAEEVRATRSSFYSNKEVPMTGDKWHAEGRAMPPACYEFAQQLAPGVYLIAAVVYIGKTSLYSARVAWYDFRTPTYYRYSIHARKFSTAPQAMAWCEMVQSTVQQMTKDSCIASLNTTGMG